MLAPTFGQNQARSTPIQDLGVIYDRRYRYAIIEWYNLVDSKRFSIYEFDSMLEDLDIKGGSFLFSYFRIPGKSLDEGLVPLISHQDVLSLLKYVPSYKEIEVYIKKHMMEVVSGKGKGVVIEEIMEDDEVNEASETGYRGQSLLLNENDVQTENMDSTSKVDHPPWSFGCLSDSDISEHPPWSSKSMNEKRNTKRSEEFCDYERSISGLVGDLKTWNDDDDLLQQVYPYDWQQDPYHGDDEAEENAELFAKLDDLLEQLPFLNDELKENMVGVDAPVVAVEEKLERIKHVVDEEIERPKKRKRENEDESASVNVLPFGKIKQEEKVESSLEGREGNERLWFLKRRSAYRWN
ncbi:hypothetical protein Tco_1556563 [Tanacetum coccineum]